MEKKCLILIDYNQKRKHHSGFENNIKIFVDIRK